jgi:hypothetical protein
MGDASELLETLQILASGEAQIAYAREVPQAHVAGELISFLENAYQPTSPSFVAALTDAQHRALARIYGLAMESGAKEPRSVEDLLHLPEWRRVMALSAELLRDLASRHNTSLERSRER